MTLLESQYITECHLSSIKLIGVYFLPWHLPKVRQKGKKYCFHFFSKSSNFCMIPRSYSKNKFIFKISIEFLIYANCVRFFPCPHLRGYILLAQYSWAPKYQCLEALDFMKIYFIVSSLRYLIFVYKMFMWWNLRSSFG